MTLCALNGEIMPLADAHISPMDRGFLFGDGVYEVLACVDGQVRARSLHEKRLAQSLAMIQLDVDIAAIFADLDALQAASGLKDAKLYVQVTRGAAPVRDHAFPTNIQPTVFLSISPFTAKRMEPAAAIVREDIRWRRNAIKSVSLLANVLLMQEARAAGAAEVILHLDGWVTEASTSNVFFLKDGVLSTPPLSNAILPGITRHLVLELAEAQGLDVQERPLAVGELAAADSLFVSSSTRGLMPIASIDPGGTLRADAPQTDFSQLATAYDALLHEHQ